MQMLSKGWVVICRVVTLAVEPEGVTEMKIAAKEDKSRATSVVLG